MLGTQMAVTFISILVSQCHFVHRGKPTERGSCVPTALCRSGRCSPLGSYKALNSNNFTLLNVLDTYSYYLGFVHFNYYFYRLRSIVNSSVKPPCNIYELVQGRFKHPFVCNQKPGFSGKCGTNVPPNKA